MEVYNIYPFFKSKTLINLGFLGVFLFVFILFFLSIALGYIIVEES